MHKKFNIFMLVICVHELLLLAINGFLWSAWRGEGLGARNAIFKNAGVAALGEGVNYVVKRPQCQKAWRRSGVRCAADRGGCVVAGPARA